MRSTPARHTQSRSAVRKADKKPLPVAAYDQNGRLVGIIMDPSTIQPVTGVSPAGDKAKPAAKPSAAQAKTAPAAEASTPDDGVAKVAQLKKAVYSAPDPAERDRAAEQLNRAAIIALDIIHGRRRPPRNAA